jgi:flagellar hook-associated protein 2
MADISIPGVSDKYKTNDLVKSLVEVERLPLKREEEKLEGLKTEQANWRRVNQYMSSLRESTRSLYSFNNPFNERIAESTDERSVTATADRDATVETFKIDVDQIATADRFLSGNIDKNTRIPEGTYQFTVGEKTITYRFKGGKISDFSEGLNKRGNGIIKSSIIGVSKNESALLIESLKTGEENKLILENESLDLAIDLKMVQKIQGEKIEFAQNIDKNVNPETKIEIPLPESIKESSGFAVEFKVTTVPVEDITIAWNNRPTGPELPFAGNIQFQDVIINNDQSDTTLPPEPPKQLRFPVTDNSVLYIKKSDGTILPLESIPQDNESKEYTIKLSEYEGATSILVDNKNTGKQIQIEGVAAYNISANLGYEPLHPVSVAQNAKFRYEGIPMNRPTNEIDDVVPHVKLQLHSPTDRTADISIKNDTESAKDALITFVGNYNQLMAELNIVTQNKPEIVDELEYFTEDESEKAKERLGVFQSEFTLKSSKSSLQQIITNSYMPEENATIKTLAQIGIASKTGTTTGTSAAQMRGYMEIDEKKLDEALENNMAEIKNLFGYDTNDDKIIDAGIAYKMDQTLLAYVQTGGILAMKNTAIERDISTAETKIERLEVQVANKEAELKRKYGNMESTLNNLEAQSNSINNTFNQGNKK